MELQHYGYNNYIGITTRAVYDDIEYCDNSEMKVMIWNQSISSWALAEDIIVGVTVAVNNYEIYLQV